MVVQCRRVRVKRCKQYPVCMLRISRHARTILALVVLMAGLAACGGDSGTKFGVAGAPFTFSYPSNLQKVFADTGREMKGLDPTYRVALGTDETNVVVVATYALAKDVSKMKKANLAIAVERAARTLARAMNAKAPTRSQTTLGKLPATQFEFVSKDPPLTTRLLYAFRGKTQYFVRCQWDEKSKETIPSACEQIQQTFAPAG